MQTYIDLLQKLIRMKPVSSDADAVNRVTDTIHAFLRERGIFCTVEETEGRKVLFAATQNTKTPDFLLNAHVDVVPAADPAQFEPVMPDDTHMIGRGTADCLGNAVCIIRTLCELDKSVSAGAIFSSNEEIGGSTTAHMVRSGYGAKKFICVMDHWEDDDLIYAQKGILALKLTAHGKSGHASRPWHADNPVDKLIDGYCRFRDSWTNATEQDQWHDTMAATVLSAGMVHNQIPDTAEMRINIRYVNPEDREKIWDQVRKTTGLEVTLLENWEPVSMSPDAPQYALLADAMEHQFGKRPAMRRMNGATDARWFILTGTPIAITGVKGKGIHGSDEMVDLNSLKDYSEVMVRFAKSL